MVSVDSFSVHRRCCSSVRSVHSHVVIYRGNRVDADGEGRRAVSHINANASEFMVIVNDRVRLRDTSLLKANRYALKRKILGDKVRIVGFHPMVEP